MAVRHVWATLQEGQRLRIEPWLNGCIAALAVPLTLFGFWVALWGNVESLTLGVIFSVVLYTIAFMTVSIGKTVNRRTILDYIAAAASLIAGAYLLWRSFTFDSWVMGIDTFTTADVIAGTVYVVLTLDLLRRCRGLGFSIFVYALLAYMFLGHYLSGTLAHPAMSLATFIERVIVSQNTVGIFGQAMEIVASYAFLFVLMGRFFQLIGGGQFFFDIAAVMAGRHTGGVAKVAIVSSGLFGSVSGSPTADVMTTGSISIPMMKKMGYPGRFAASVEAVASTGGSLLPPVMGAVAFLMAELTATSYAEVAKSAIISALLYYLADYAYAHFRSEQLGLVGMPASQIPALRTVIRKGWFYVIPFVILVHFVMAGYGADYTAALTVLTVILVSWWPAAARRIGVREFIAGCVDTCVILAPLVAAVAAAGIVVAVLTFTGITGKAATVIFAITGKDMFLVLLSAMVISVLLGMGMPVVATYALSAVVVAPVMIELGVPILPAHFFLVYYAVLSFITPPIAVSCYASATIAEESPMAVGWESMLVGLITFILPFSFIYEPSLLLIGPWYETARATVFTGIGVVFASAALVGWWRGALPVWRRAILIACGLALLIPWSELLALCAIAAGIAVMADRLFLKGRAARDRADIAASRPIGEI
jgi:TRAP transporter 4TM/12TM fusion protein